MSERGLDHEMRADQAKALLGATNLPREIRLEILEQYRRDRGGWALVELFADFIGLANQVVENNREVVELTLVTEGQMHPYTAEKVNLPTIFGALNGVVLADGIDPAALCPGCAFRKGTPANQSPSTTCDADFCGHPGEEPFMCHMEFDDQGEPTRACPGFAQLRARRKRQESVT
jgi:hypothetical protein